MAILVTHLLLGVAVICSSSSGPATAFTIIKANPKYGSEKKGQPTTYYLSAAPEPIRVNCEYFYVDAVLSPDPNVFHHTNALMGLREGGTFIIQSDLGSPSRGVRLHANSRSAPMNDEKGPHPASTST